MKQLVMLSGLAAIALFGAGCSAPPDAEAAPPVPAAASAAFALVESTTVAAPLLLPSQLYVERDAILGARSSGVLRTLSADLGVSVRAGDVVARLEDDAQKLAQTRATVALERARQIAWRAREMRASNSIPTAELEDAEFAQRDAEVAKREADLALERTSITAPFDGIVTARYVQAGRLLALNDTVLRVTARGPYLARTRLPEAHAASLRVGAKIPVRVTGAGQTTGTVRRLSPAIDAASGTREAIVQVGTSAQVGSGALMPGRAVTVEVPRGNQRVLTIPAAALTPDGYVVVQQNGRTIMRPVVTGDSINGRVVVMAGLTSGERVRVPASGRVD